MALYAITMGHAFRDTLPDTLRAVGAIPTEVYYHPSSTLVTVDALFEGGRDTLKNALHDAIPGPSIQIEEVKYDE